MKGPLTPEVRERWMGELKGNVAALEAMFASGSRLTLLVRNDAMGEEVFLCTNEPDPLDAFRQAAEFLKNGKVSVDMALEGEEGRGA